MLFLKIKMTTFLPGAMLVDAKASGLIAQEIDAMRPKAWPGPKGELPEDVCYLTKEGGP